MSDNKPLSKEEILNLENSRPDEMQTDWIVVTRKAALAAMDEYAKQEAIGFYRWIMSQEVVLNFRSEEHLYEKYLQQKQQPR